MIGHKFDNAKLPSQLYYMAIGQKPITLRRISHCGELRIGIFFDYDKTTIDALKILVHNFVGHLNAGMLTTQLRNTNRLKNRLPIL